MSAPLLSANFSKAFIGTIVGISDITVVVQGGHTLPVLSGNFIAIMWNSSLYNTPAIDPNAEFIVASFSGTANLYNITRAQENTIAVPHAVNDSITLVYSAGMRTSDLAILGTTQVDETGIADTFIISYNQSSQKLKYINPLSLIPSLTHGYQVFTSSGTFIAPAGVSTVFLSMIGGGGNGGNGNVTNTSGGGGGGAGQLYLSRPYPVTPGNSYTVTINGSGASTVFDTITCVAGSNGASGNHAVNAGGDSGGKPGVTGGASCGGLWLGTAPSSGQNIIGGDGVGTPFGNGGHGVANSDGTSPTVNSGAGGAGGGGSGNGSNGAAGIVIVVY